MAALNTARCEACRQIRTDVTSRNGIYYCDECWLMHQSLVNMQTIYSGKHLILCLKVQARNAASRVINSAENFTWQEWFYMLEAYDFKCANCGKGWPLTVDHIIPVRDGGSNAIENIQPLCRVCNSRKG